MKTEIAGDISTRLRAQIPPRSLQTNPARFYDFSFRGSLSFSEARTTVVFTLTLLSTITDVLFG